ncbi:MAG: tRNA dihydrouridine synthase DusB [Spirochaetales bacterium]|nr:tRNA dihydrouridine synthase DusB [Spirochaetales bacterium]
MKQLYHPVTLGSLKIPGNLFLAPVAGFSDAPFRTVRVCRGANLAYTEMISCEGICRENKKTLDLLLPDPEEGSPAVQLFGSDPGRVARAAERILPYLPPLIDLNCGCPVPKVVKTGAGSALMKDPPLIGRIVSALRKALDRSGHGNIPITVKLRSGWDAQSITFLDAALAAVDAGVSMITLHPRTRSQGYSGTSDWNLIGRLKERIPVPVFGSGDLFTPAAAKAMLLQTGCDGLMFARGAMADPFIFSRTRSLLETGELPGNPSKEELLEAMEQHLEAALQFYGEEAACRIMRKHFCSYTKGLPGGGEIRKRVSTAVTRKEYTNLLQEISERPF